MRTRNFLIALLLLLFNFGAIAADPPLDVKLLWEGPYTISVKKDSDTLRIPVTISTSGVGAADLVVLLRSDDPLSGKLSGRFESDSLKTNWLVMSIAHIEEIRPDSYTSFILVSRKQTELRQTLKLTIVVKAAAVTVTPGLSLTYTRTLWGKDELKGPPLVLSENSGESRLGKFRIIGKQQSADGAPGTSLEFMPASESVEPLGTDTIHLNIANRPALGSSSGKFDVMAARLGTPLTFQVDLVTRLSGVYLVIFLLIGLACGLFFRIWLNYDIELSKARLAATEILTRILDEIKKRNDPVFIASAYSIYRDLDKAKEKTKAVEITAESVTAESALTAAVNDFNTRSTAVKSKLTEIENLLWGSWLLPATFSPAIEEKQNEFEVAKLKYESGNMVLASQATVNLDRLIAKDFFEIAFNYRSQTNVSISAIEQARLAIPDLAGTMAPIKMAIAGIATAQTGTTASTLLSAVQQTHTNLPDLLNDLQNKVCKQVNDVLQTFDESNLALPDPAAVKALRDESARVFSEWAKLTDFEQRLEAIGNSLDSLFKLILHAIMNQAEQIKGSDDDKEKANESARRQIRGKIDTGDTLNAVLDCIQLLKENSPSPAQEGMSKTKALKMQDVSNPQYKRPGPTGITDKTIQPTEKQTTDSKHLLRNLVVAQSVQTAFAGIGIVLVGYITFKESFTGSLPNFVSAFFWAFGMDISIGTLMNSAGKLGKS